MLHFCYKTGSRGGTNAELAYFDLMSSEQVSSFLKETDFLVRNSALSLSILLLIDMSWEGEKSFEALNTYMIYQASYRFDGWRSWKRSEPMMTCIDFPQQLNRLGNL